MSSLASRVEPPPIRASMIPMWPCAEARAKGYKTFQGRNFQKFVISYSVCP